VTLIDLSGRVALVTGGSRGIGAATAVMLADAGADVALTYRTRKDEAEKVGKQIERIGRQWTVLQADLSRREDCERVVRETAEAYGKLDIFVANAGIWPPEDVPVSGMTDEQWRTTMATNLDSVFWGTRAALKAMKRGGRVVIVTSTAGQRGEAMHADYAATKGALISFVKSVAVEVGKEDITVNSVAPGWVDTEMSSVPYERETGNGKRQIEKTIPLGRVASAQDVAGPIVFLCSSLARHITGEILNVNGGSVLCG
jgi:3-oxoacyl-[acyl-carrier protein] reductase